MAKNKRNSSDFYTLKAQSQGYPARSIYKLEEIQNKFSLIKKGDRVLDVGAAPGSWTLYLQKKLIGHGSVVAIDLNPLKLNTIPSNIKAIVGDAFSKENKEKLIELGPYDVIVSDAAPKTSGNRSVDTSKSHYLCEQVLLLSLTQLKEKGHLVMKIFQGSGIEDITNLMRTHFLKVKSFKPKACRSDSFETYLIGIEKVPEGTIL